MPILGSVRTIIMSAIRSNSTNEDSISVVKPSINTPVDITDFLSGHSFEKALYPSMRRVMLELSTVSSCSTFLKLM